MPTTSCLLCSDYLANDLEGEARAQFAAHLLDCQECRRAVDEHERLAGLLAAALTQCEPIPAGLADRIERRLRAHRRRRQLALGLALAGLAAALWLFLRPTAEPPPPVPGPGPVASTPELAKPPEKAHISFPPSAHVLALPAQLDDPNVTFVWVYPGLRARPARAGDDPPALPERSNP